MTALDDARTDHRAFQVCEDQREPRKLPAMHRQRQPRHRRIKSGSGLKSAPEQKVCMRCSQSSQRMAFFFVPPFATSISASNKIEEHGEKRSFSAVLDVIFLSFSCIVTISLFILAAKVPTPVFYSFPFPLGRPCHIRRPVSRSCPLPHNFPASSSQARLLRRPVAIARSTSSV